MMPFTLTQLLTYMSAIIFLIGLLTFLIGVSILFFNSFTGNTRKIQKQITKIAQKGMTDQISGLVGNASSLLTATRDLIQTTRGIGTFLTFTGAFMMLAGTLLALHLGKQELI
jgi:hypothetical protein